MGREPDRVSTPEALVKRLVELSTKGAIQSKTLPPGTPNRLAFTDVPAESESESEQK
jgi:hypothetical protein